MKKIVTAAVATVMVLGTLTACKGSHHTYSCDSKAASSVQLAAYEKPRPKKGKKKVVVHRHVVVHKHVVVGGKGKSRKRHHSSHDDDDC